MAGPGKGVSLPPQARTSHTNPHTDPARRLAALTAALALIFGMGYAFLMPPLQAPDEFVHFLRAYEISHGHFISLGAVSVPVPVAGFIESFPPRLLSGTGEKDPIRKTDLSRFLHLPPDDSTTRTLKLGNVYLYSCVPYLPVVIAIRIGLLTHAPPLALLYVGRLAALVFFVALTYVSLRMIPAGQLAMAFVALLPMTLHQAAAVSADAATISLAFLLIAYTLRLALDSSVGRLSARQYVALGCLILACALSKPSPWLALVPAVIPAAKFPPRRKWLMVALAWGMGLAAVAAWQSINHANFDRFIRSRDAREIDTAANTRFLLRHPASAAASVTAAVGREGGQLVDQFVGRLGWLEVSLPPWLIWGCAALLLVAAMPSGAPVRPWQRGVLIALFLTAVVTLFVGQAIIEVPDLPQQGALLGRSILDAVQGRYLIPLAPLFLVALSGLRPRFSPGLAGLCLAAAALASGVAFLAIWKTYYFPGKPAGRVSLGVWRQGEWVLHSYTRRGQQNIEPGDVLPGDLPVPGDWNGDGRSELGIYRQGVWILDTNTNQRFDDHDARFSFGGLAGDIPVAGDWNGDGKSKAGIYRHGLWILDLAGNRTENGARIFGFGGLPGDVPVAGDWNGNGITKVGIYRGGLWLLDFEGRQSEQGDRVFPFGGIPVDIPVVGDWTGQGKALVGIYRQGIWVLDSNGDYRMGGPDRVFAFEAVVKGEIPVMLSTGR
jgi:uncharacterized membrane protein